MSSLDRDNVDILAIRPEICKDLLGHNSLQRNIEHEPDQHWANPVKRQFISLGSIFVLREITYACSAGFGDILTEIIRQIKKESEVWLQR